MTYDLRILWAENEHPTAIFYERSELSEPSHKVETPLVPAAKYFWKIRARFLLDGITRVTPWAQIRGSAFSDLVVPNRYYFGLKTPSR